jgi:hypothetical protein
MVMPNGGGGDRYWVAAAEATGTGGGGDSGQTARERRRGREMRAKGYMRLCKRYVRVVFFISGN